MLRLYVTSALQQYSTTIRYCWLLIVVAALIATSHTLIFTFVAWHGSLFRGSSNSRHLTGRLNIHRTEVAQNTQDILPCPAKPAGLYGPVTVRHFQNRANATSGLKTRNSLNEQTRSGQWKRLFERHGSNMFNGGHYQPDMCRARQQVALIIPYRNREEHLRAFLDHMLPILKRQLLEFKIYVVEQSDEPVEQRFNRGLLLNIGFVEAVRDFQSWTCFIFHDVDLLPENDNNLYVCDEKHPKHMSLAVSKVNYNLPYKTFFGGIEAFPADTFRNINGFSNLYWGWGMEDDDLGERVALRNISDGYRILRPDAAIARYTALLHRQHTKKDASPERLKIRASTAQNMYIDGLTSLRYKVKQMEKFPVFYWLKVEISKTDYIVDPYATIRANTLLRARP